MNLEVTIKLDSEALSAVNALTAAIRNLGGVNHSTNSSVSSQAESEEAAGPIYWADNSTGKFGVVDTEAAYLSLKKKAKGVVKITEQSYGKKSAEAEKADDQDVDAEEEKDTAKKAAAKATTKAADKPAAKKPAPKAEAEESDLTLEDVVAVFSEYLSKDLDAAERKERAGFVKPMLQRLGASKASELAEEHFALAINLVKRKMAGEDLDPETAEFEEIEEDGLV